MWFPKIVSFGSLLAVAFALTGIPAASAAIINYGNYTVGASGLTFIGVTESSGTDAVPLYDVPEVTPTGLDFDPKGFVSSSTGGATDVTDGQLNYTLKSVVTPTGGVGINSLSIFESGDYTLVGTGTPATAAYAGANLKVTIMEVDGVSITPLSMPASNASIGFNLVSNPGIVQPWSLGLSVGSINSFLTSNYGSFTYGATRVDVAIDNSLLSLSQTGTVAFIAKKDFEIAASFTKTGVIPEPAPLGLAGAALALLTPARRRRG